MTLKDIRVATKYGLRTTRAILTFLTVSSVLILLMGKPIHCAQEYVYYGVVPPKIHFARKSVSAAVDFEVPPWSVAGSALLSVVASRDNTNVKIYSLPEGALVGEAALNTMDKRFFSLPNGTFFKVVSNDMVSAVLLGWGPLDPGDIEGPTPHAFYTAADGSYVGKEFVFVACQWSSTPSPYRVIALEDAQVTITREDGTKQSFELEANTDEKLALKAFSAYKVESTGNVMVQSSGLGEWQGACEEDVKSSFFVPSAQGGFMGKRFYSDSTASWDPIDDNGFRISALEDSTVTVWDVRSRRTMQELEVKRGAGASIKPKGELIALESDKPVTLAYIENGSMGSEESYHSCSYNAGVMYLGVKANEETPFFVPADSNFEAYVFAYEDTVVKIGDLTLPIKADSYFQMPIPGTHKIISDKNVVIEVIHWPKVPSIQGLKSFGAVVPCIQAANVTPDVKLTPLGAGEEEKFPTTLIIAGAAAAVVVAAAGFIALRRRTK
ncbi:MAG: hypothetical protein OEY31_06560 [Candidatus Bathyarchaeota archaeon]|nr:hypothetical protein [Candidatus Bathyarchaeota archaeon]